MRALFSTLLIFAVACGAKESTPSPTTPPANEGTPATLPAKAAPASTAPAAAKVAAGETKEIVLNISGMS